MTKAIVKRGSTAVTNWADELANQAADAANQELSTAMGTFISVKGGVMTFNDTPFPDNHAPVIILDSILENVYYPGAYDPNSPQSPVCFAFGRDAESMKPHDSSLEKQSATCGTCKWNEFGTADRGKGKACRNTRRMALLSAGDFKNDKFVPFTDEDHFRTTPIAFFKLAPTSVRGYAAFVKQIASAFARPPRAVFAEMKCVPDAKTQFKVLFSPLGLVPDELLPAIMERYKGVKDSIDFPYQVIERSEKPTRGRAEKPAAKPARKPKY